MPFRPGSAQGCCTLMLRACSVFEREGLLDQCCLYASGHQFV